MQVVNANDLIDLIDCLYIKTKTQSEKKVLDEVINIIYDIEREEGETEVE